jgi:hypothetical protein
VNNIWGLPKTAKIGEEIYTINTDFRDVLEILSYLNDANKPNYLKWQIAISLFYDGEIPDNCQYEAMEYLSAFLSYGESENKPAAKLIDWEQDAQVIIGDINKIAGKEIRECKYLHWWTFLSYFYGIGEGQLSTIVSIRSKKNSGKKLEKWEEEYYRKNKHRIDFQKKKTEEDEAVQEYFSKWL